MACVCRFGLTVTPRATPSARGRRMPLARTSVYRPPSANVGHSCARLITRKRCAVPSKLHVRRVREGSQPSRALSTPSCSRLLGARLASAGQLLSAFESRDRTCTVTSVHRVVGGYPRSPARSELACARTSANGRSAFFPRPCCRSAGAVSHAVV